MKKIKRSEKKKEQNELLKFKQENRKKEEFQLSLSMQKVAKIIARYFQEQGWTDANANYGMAWRLIEPGEEGEDALQLLITMVKNPELKGLGTESMNTTPKIEAEEFTKEDGE